MINLNCPHKVGDRVRHHPVTELRPAAAHQADQQGQAVPARGRRGGRLPAARPGADPPDPLGTDRPAVRPDDQVCDGDPYPDRVGRGDTAPLHPQRLPPYLRGHAGGRPRPEDHLRRPLPAAARPAAGNRGGPERHGVLQRRQLRHRVRQRRRDHLEPPTSRRCSSCACGSSSPPWSS